MVDDSNPQSQALTTATDTIAPSTGIQKYLDSALGVLGKLGIQLREAEESRLVTLLEEVRDVDAAKVLAIAQTVKHIGSFNEMVRGHVGEMRVADRYDVITGMFDSIVSDSRNLVQQLADGRIDWREKAQNLWMRVARGTTHDRFERIRTNYNSVQTDVKDQLDKESEILGAYRDYRFAVKGAEGLAYEVLKIQEGKLTSAKSALDTAQGELDRNKDAEKSVVAGLQLKRDEAKSTHDSEDRRYQLIKDVAENLSDGYNISDMLMMKLKQTHDTKDAVYRRSVTFFTTNETVFTTLDAIFTSQKGLHEITQSYNAMLRGAERGMQAVAEVGQGLEAKALEAAHGKTYNIQVVESLIKAVVDYQTDSVQKIAQYRKEATANTEAIREKTDAARRKLTETITKYLPSPQPA